jgi:hypothetical protein
VDSRAADSGRYPVVEPVGRSACRARLSSAVNRHARTRPRGADRRLADEVRRCRRASIYRHLRRLSAVTDSWLPQSRRRRLRLCRMPGSRQTVHCYPRQHLGRGWRSGRVNRRDRQAAHP